MRLGLFGGTFNPIHYGHLRAAEEAREKAGLDRVFFIPAGNPPLKSGELADAALRLSMTRLAAASNKHFETLDIECAKGGISYSVDTVALLKESHPSDELFFILGSDAFMDIQGWMQPERLVGLVDFIILNRPPQTLKDVLSSPYLMAGIGRRAEGVYGATLLGGRSALFLNITALDISATAIRKLIREGKSVKYLLPEKVESFIMSNGLYGV